MSSRALRLTIAIALIVLLLFTGRWVAGVLADRWWAETISADAARFVTGWALLRFFLESAGILISCLWFIGNLLLVYRAIGSVQVHRRLGNLEIREAVNMGLLRGVSVAGGLLLGIAAGRGWADRAPEVVLAWNGLQVGEADPLLGRDLGFYLARLPALRLIDGYIILLLLLGVSGAIILYAVIGALRWQDRRLLLNDQARFHIGALAVLLALALTWGYLLEPYQLVGGVIGTVHAGLYEFRRAASTALAGVALAAALLSLVWTLRGRHTLLLGIWLILGAASLLGHHIIPAVIGGDRTSALDPAARRHLDQLAYGMVGIRDSSRTHPSGEAEPPRPPAFWDATLVADATVGDSGRVVAVDRAVVSVGRQPRPAWLAVRDQGSRGATLTVVLDDRLGPQGQPLIYREGDSLGAAGEPPRLRVPTEGVWPGGREPVLVDSTIGVDVGVGFRRLALAWALQSGALLSPTSAGQHAIWRLDPEERLATLAPYVTWGVPAPRLIGGELVWLVDGFVASRTFPGSTRVKWRGHWVGSLRAGLLGVIRARSGATAIYLRHSADPVAESWHERYPGIVQPASSMPSDVVRALAYPVELLEAQLRVLTAPQWELGNLIGRDDPIGREGSLPDALWEPDTSGVEHVIPFERPQTRQVSAVLQAAIADGRESLELIRYDSLLTLPDPGSLDTRWGRIPTYQQLRDSVEKAGARVEAGPVRYWPTPAGLGAYQTQFARREGQEPTLVWVSLAVADRRGAGHDLEEAWQNLLGLTAPIISASERGALMLELRRQVTAADAALKRGDLESFGRYWAAIQRLLGTP